MFKVTKHKLRVFSLFTVFALLIIAFPVQSIAYSDIYIQSIEGALPTTPTEGITSGENYVIRTTSGKYFGFTTGDAICDDEPTDNNTEWTFTYVGNGKYRISYSGDQRYGFLNAYGEDVMPAPNDEEWYVIKNPNGTYSLHPSDDVSRFLAAKEDATTHQTMVSALDPVETPDASSYNWNWEIIVYSARIEVEAYYDTGFKLRYGSSSDATSKNRILSIVNECQDLFFEEFGIYLSNTAKGYKESSCDVCMTVNPKKTIDGQCQHYTPNKDKHTYWLKVAEDFADTNPINIYFKKQVLFVGSKTYDENGTVNGVSCSYPPTTGSRHGHICIMKIYNSSIYDSRQGMVYAHEMAHQFGAPDHYCSYIIKDNNKYCLNGNYCNNKDHGPAGKIPRSEYCIMDNMGGEDSSAWYYKTSLSGWSSLDSVFCEQCKRDMKNYISNYYNN